MPRSEAIPRAGRRGSMIQLFRISSFVIFEKLGVAVKANEVEEDELIY